MTNEGWCIRAFPRWKRAGELEGALCQPGKRSEVEEL